MHVAEPFTDRTEYESQHFSLYGQEVCSLRVGALESVKSKLANLTGQLCRRFDLDRGRVDSEALFWYSSAKLIRRSLDVFLEAIISGTRSDCVYFNIICKVMINQFGISIKLIEIAKFVKKSGRLEKAKKPLGMQGVSGSGE